MGLLLAGSLLASCTGFQVADQSLQFNQATGSVGNRLMLLNAIRAAKGYPLQFSKVTGYTGQGTVDGGLTLELPFVLNTFGSPSATRILGGASPTAGFKTGVSQLQLADLNTAEIQRELRRLVTVNDFAYYRSQGWQSALVNTILIEELHVEPDLVRAVDAASLAACKVAKHLSVDVSRKKACVWLQAARSKCKHHILPNGRAVQRRASPEGPYVLVYANDPRQPCRFDAFQWFFASIRVLDGASLDVDTKVNTDECKSRWAPPDADEPEKDAQEGKKKSMSARGRNGGGKEVSESVSDGKVSVDIGVNLRIGKDKKDEDDRTKDSRPFVLNIPRDLRPKVVPSGADAISLVGSEFTTLARLREEYICLRKTGREPIRIGWRSPERMVRYLGDVLAVQAFGEAKTEVRILSDEGDQVQLFRAEKGRVRVKAVVSVEGPESERFHIPSPEYRSSKSHLSLQALALVMEAFNLAVSGKELPQPPTLLLSGG